VLSLAEHKSLCIPLSGLLLRLPGYGKDVVMNVDGHVFFLHAREIECYCCGVRFFRRDGYPSSVGRYPCAGPDNMPGY